MSPASDEPQRRGAAGPEDAQEPVVVTDKRRIDPQTGEARDGASDPAHNEPGSEALAPDTSDALAELTADLQRVQADFANYRKRALRDQQLVSDRAKAAVVSQLLGVLDDLDRARSHGDLDSGPLKAVADKLSSTLDGLGLAAYGDEGDAFDPELHEAVQHEGDGSNPVVGNVLRRGYRLGDQVLRHAMVAVVDTVDEPDTNGFADEAAGDAAESEASASNKQK